MSLFLIISLGVLAWVVLPMPIALVVGRYLGYSDRPDDAVTAEAPSTALKASAHAV